MGQKISEIEINKIEKTAMTSSEAIDVCARLDDSGVGIWIDGGWCVDALMGKPLRIHKDLDIAVQWKDVARLREVLAKQGYKQIREDSQWNFILAVGESREIDVHAFVCDDKGEVVEGIMYPAESLTGTGIIGGHAVKCISPKYMIEFLSPFVSKFPEKYLGDIAALCEKYKIDLPKEHKALTSSK